MMRERRERFPRSPFFNSAKQARHPDDERFPLPMRRFRGTRDPRAGESVMRPLKIALALSLVVGSFAVRPAFAQADRAAAASEPKLWSTPWDGRPRDPFADQKGNVWFVG